MWNYFACEITKPTYQPNTFTNCCFQSTLRKTAMTAPGASHRLSTELLNTWVLLFSMDNALKRSRTLPSVGENVTRQRIKTASLPDQSCRFYKISESKNSKHVNFTCCIIFLVAKGNFILICFVLQCYYSQLAILLTSLHFSPFPDFYYL